ncbi:Fe-S cluster biogenesis protein NfuA, 4Fe-4S-binding domain [Halopelagius inordinatus]|uniref:Fe-S cluster biogenesis protein NfuA, 4Fe-4S-binding domain n=1 Tax=Halopelagius inordinatus TaxID=553467 RepID=A0A1I2P7I8_9EURY|nr:NifU family protein [Halopelagius inordinatus]SFG12105.1 Fe-S cluster biogenesis protein NfuA, 4Fe-4S-binding domain [Halopelagius inordinatus]
MSIESTPDGAEESLEERIDLFVRRNFPQIQMHGGAAGIDAVDEETGTVWISLTGACSGCGISPMTVQALKSRMVAEFEAVSDVHVSTGGAFDYEADAESDPFERSRSDAPF